MAKEVLLYSNIDGYSAQDFINAVGDATGELTVRVNTNGGIPEYSWGMVKKFQEYSEKKYIKVDGKAYSAGCFMLCYAETDNTECLDVSDFLIHRAAYSSWFESDPNYFTKEVKDSLQRVNDNLKNALLSKTTAENFLKVTGKSIDDVFSLDDRIDVYLDSKQAKKLGLIGKIVSITPQKQAEVNALMATALGKERQGTQVVIETESLTKNKEVKMTIEKLKAEHPDIYASVVALGVAKEKDRATAWLTFNEIDAKAVADGVKSGLDITMTAMAEFSLKSLSAQAVVTLEAESATAVQTTEAPTAVETEKAQAISAFEKAVLENLKN